MIASGNADGGYVIWEQQRKVVQAIALDYILRQMWLTQQTFSDPFH